MEGANSFICAVEAMAGQKCKLSVDGYSDCLRTKYFEKEPIQRRFDLVMCSISAGQTSLRQVQSEFTLDCFFENMYIL